MAHCSAPPNVKREREIERERERWKETEGRVKDKNGMRVKKRFRDRGTEM